MKRLLDYGFRLFLVCAVASLCVAGLFTTAKENIDRNAVEELNTALAAVLGTSEGIVETADGSGVYRIETEAGPLYAALGGGQGYSSVVEAVVAARLVDGELEIVKMRIKSQQETPGLGTVIADKESSETLWTAIGGLFGGEKAEEGPERYGFLDQFEKKRVKHLRVTLSQEEAATGEAILGISGATISSDASVKAARDALAKIRGEVDGGR
jgi:Na+-translocating ferredoxin:NAD+ oxidoreductase RnfG subunit